MPPKDHFSDDYIAKLLAKDAKASTAKYSSYGLNALLPKRPTTNAPKPNTRFLKNIIKETDSHNAALRAKEGAEAKDRLRRLRGDAEGDKYDDDYGRLKRRRVDYNDEADREVRQKHKRQESHRSGNYDHKHHRSSHRQCVNDSSSEEDEAKHSRRRKERDHDSRRRSRRYRDDGHNNSGVEDGERSHRRRHRHCPDRQRSRHRSEERDPRRRKPRRRSQSPSLRRHHDHHHHRSRRRRHSLSPTPPTQFNDPTANPPTNVPPSPPSPTSSDPLTSLLGPQPPLPHPLPRGRGTTNLNSSTIDTHFSPSYNPHLDTPSSHDDDDWDQALEALKDRRRWKAMGAERLREAGFGEEVVEKWEGGGLGGGGVSGGGWREGGDGDVGSVRWRGRGEGREWDRGKVVTEAGVETGAEWGRLKGT